MNISGVETILIVVIVLIQIVIFLRTRRKIAILRDTFSDSWQFETLALYIPRETLALEPPEKILSETSKFIGPADVDGFDESVVRVVILTLPEDANVILQRIYYSINRYLLRNAHGAPDFSLIKDVSERGIDALEEEIHLTISLPLYLGLMGTMLGIVIGLFSMSDVSLSFTGSIRDEQLASGIQVLLGGVKIAMIASFVGLFLTIVNSGWFFRRAKNFVEYQKNIFYLYLQSELLPTANENLASTFESLRRNLTFFNESFAGNVERLSGVFNTNIDGLRIQQEIIQSIEDIDLAEVAQYNVKVLKEIRGSTKEFEKLNQHFANVNSFVETSDTLAIRLQEILQRTSTIESGVDAYVQNMERSQTLLDFVALHLQDLENHKRITNESIAEVGLAIKEAFGDLREHIHASTKDLEEFTVHEVDMLKKALADSRTNLSNLEYLGTIKEDLSLFKFSTASQGESIRVRVGELQNTATESNRLLAAIERQNATSTLNNIAKSLKRIFRSENGDEST